MLADECHSLWVSTDKVVSASQPIDVRGFSDLCNDCSVRNDEFIFQSCQSVFDWSLIGPSFFDPAFSVDPMDQLLQMLELTVIGSHNHVARQ